MVYFVLVSKRPPASQGISDNNIKKWPLLIEENSVSLLIQKVKFGCMIKFKASKFLKKKEIDLAVVSIELKIKTKYLQFWSTEPYA